MDLKERLLQLKKELKKKKIPSKAHGLNTQLFNDETKSLNQSYQETTTKEQMSEKERQMLDDFHTFNESTLSPASIALAKYVKSKKQNDMYLNHKVDEFIKWYYVNCVKGNYTDIGEYQFPREMRNFIEKMAVWYELRYPEYEVNRLMPGSGQESIEVSDVMFNENKYINDQLDEESEVRILDWDKFYNTKAFINSLPWEERVYFNKPKYSDIVYFDLKKRTAHLHLTKNGIVEFSELHHLFDEYGITDENLVGMHIKDVLSLFREKDIKLPENNELEQNVRRVDTYTKCKEEMLNSVMYRIIERGGNRVGPRRAFLFAKEFGRNIDIPMMYAVDYSDPGLRRFMNEYIKAGGSKDLECLVGYFSRTSDTEKLDRVSISELILTLHNDAATFYTPEENELHQRLVNVLSNQVDQDIVKKEEVKQLRLQRKLEKSRNNK